MRFMLHKHEPWKNSVWKGSARLGSVMSSHQSTKLVFNTRMSTRFLRGLSPRLLTFSDPTNPCCSNLNSRSPNWYTLCSSRVLSLKLVLGPSAKVRRVLYHLLPKSFVQVLNQDARKWTWQTFAQ